MTPTPESQALRVAVAVADGWTEKWKGEGYYTHPDSKVDCRADGLENSFPLPALTLDWMHELEAKLTVREWAYYVDFLCDEVADGSPDPNVEDLIRLTVEQRARAFIATKGRV